MPTIVIVEDDVHIAQLLEQMLEDDYTIVRASNGALGVDAVRVNRPDLVVMDLTMPVMDGASAIRALRSDPETASVPIVALSASRESDDISRAIASGADAYAPKPIDPARLKSVIARLLTRPTTTTRLSDEALEAVARAPAKKD